MPQFELAPGVQLFYRKNDFTDPWRTPETVLMLHGYAESGLTYNGWVPQLARRFRVVRPDMRGFGSSTPMPDDFSWTVETVIDDYVRLADRVGAESFHLVGSKVGGALALRLAATHPDRVRTLTIAGSTFVGGLRERTDGGNGAERRAQYERDGVEAWARNFVKGRMGSDCSAEMLEGWAKLLGATPLSTAVGFVTAAPGVSGIDSTIDLPRIRSPILAIITEEGQAGYAEGTRAALAHIPGSEVVVLAGDSIHPAATYPEACAQAMLRFLDRHSGRGLGGVHSAHV